MSKILVIYHSQQFGNTNGLAEALAEGGSPINIVGIVSLVTVTANNEAIITIP